MKTKIISQMRNIVADVMTSFQTDFENYDRPYIESEECQFPMIWGVARSHTILLKLGGYREWFFDNEAVRYGYIQEGDGFTVQVNHSLHKDDLWFLITEEEVKQITKENVLNAIQDYVTPTIREWEAQNGPLPKSAKIPVTLRNIRLKEFKELIHDCERHHDNSLMVVLKRFHNWRRVAADHRIELFYHPKYQKFSFREYINGKTSLHGAVVFHGWPETGYFENGSVQLSPQYGWSTHT